MVKLVLEKAEEPEVKLPTSAGSSKSKSSRKTSLSALLTMPKPLTVWITINCENSERDGSTRPPDLPLEKPICRSGNNSWNWTWNNRLVPNRKGVCQGCILSPYLFNLYAEYIMRNVGLEEAQAGIKTAGRNINNLRYVDDTTLMAESEEELKSLLMKVKEQSEKDGSFSFSRVKKSEILSFKLNIQKTKIMASGLITSWQTERETVETVADFIFGGLQNHCRW